MKTFIQFGKAVGKTGFKFSKPEASVVTSALKTLKLKTYQVQT